MNIKKRVEYAQCMDLLKSGLSQKEVSEKLGIPEKTISTWRKNSPQRKAQLAQSNILDRLVKDKNLSCEEVAQLTDSVLKLKKVMES